MLSTSDPKQYEIWDVNLNPVAGSELGKSRPVVVISNDIINRSTLRIVVPITEYKPKHESFIWIIKITPDKTNNLLKDSAIDSMNVRSVDISRFQRRRGSIKVELLQDILRALKLITDIT